jgi:hypothetical protein
MYYRPDPQALLGNALLQTRKMRGSDALLETVFDSKAAFPKVK